MSQVPPAPPAPTFRRHAWGWPAGSVRALLALGILGLLWVIVLIHPGEKTSQAEKHLPTLLLSLQVLMVLCSPTSSRPTARRSGGTSARHRRWACRAGRFASSWRPATSVVRGPPLQPRRFRRGAESGCPGVVAARDRRGAGGLLRRDAHLGRGPHDLGDPPPSPYQDLEAWVAMLALIGLVVVALLHLINWKVPPERKSGWSTPRPSCPASSGCISGRGPELRRRVRDLETAFPRAPRRRQGKRRLVRRLEEGRGELSGAFSSASRRQGQV